MTTITITISEDIPEYLLNRIKDGLVDVMWPDANRGPLCGYGMKIEKTEKRSQLEWNVSGASIKKPVVR